ncbi:hypothetical protein KAU33_16720 [Candidatus Dependentiae bacterium]|nr:hypothetical protein [Candidatus Dependentiae bacterium]
MKKIFLILFTFSILFNFFLNNDISAETSNNSSVKKENRNIEKYVRKELYTLTWGEGENELGGGFHSECSCGPEKIMVNNLGEIFIYDFCKDRILILTDKGENISNKFNSQFIENISRGTVDFTFDKDNNLYILADTGRIEILSYKNKLKQNKMTMINMNIRDLYNYEIKVDKNNNIILLGDPVYLIEPGIINNWILKKYKNNKGEILQELKYCHLKVTKDKNISYIKTKYYRYPNEKEASITTPSLREIKLNLHCKGRGKIELVLKGEDKYGNIYLFLRIYYINQPGPYKDIFQKYDKDGNWITNIEIDKDDSDLYLFLSENHPIIYVDEEGNIYHLWIKEKEAKVIKWELVK